MKKKKQPTKEKAVARALALLGPRRRALVARALALLGSRPPNVRVLDVEAVAYGMRLAQREKNFRKSGLVVLTKEQKVASRKFAIALQRLEPALKNAPWCVTVGFPLDEADLRHWREKADTAAATKLGRPDPSNRAAQSAVRTAAALLRKYRQPLNVTRCGKFCRLAAIIYGDARADLFRQCQAYKRQRPEEGSE